MRRQGTIRSRLTAMVAAPLMALVIVGVAGTMLFVQFRVGGPVDDRIDSSQELVADVLPPPLYIVEAYATVLQVSSRANAADREELLGRFQRLETEFRQRDAVWRRDLEDSGLRRALLDDSFQPAAQFFSVVDNQLVPLVRAGDYGAAQGLANGTVTDLYERHRIAIDDVVQRARADQRITEADAAASTRKQAIVVGLILLGLFAISLLAAARIARSIAAPVKGLQRIATVELPAVIEQVKHQGFDEGRAPRVEPIPISSRDEFGDVAAAFNTVVQAAVDLAGEQARLRQNTADTFVNLGRRNQNLVARQLRAIDGMQASEVEPGRLQSLFQLDHMATRMRRNAESLLVLAGLEAPRKWKQPVPIADVARASMAEVEQYQRVSLAVLQAATLPGYMVADLTHMLAELVENALRCSPPDSTVTLTGGYLKDCYQIAVVDQGMGLPPRELAAANARLTAEEGFDEAPTAQLGLYVVARLARRHGLQVELESDGGYGLTAYVSVPLSCIEQAEIRDDAARAPGQFPRVVVSVPSARGGEANGLPTGHAQALSLPAAPSSPPPVESTPHQGRPDVAVPPAEPSTSGLGVTRTGLPKRSSKLRHGDRTRAATSPAGPTHAGPPAREPRQPERVRALYDGFTSGRRKARAEPLTWSVDGNGEG